MTGIWLANAAAFAVGAGEVEGLRPAVGLGSAGLSLSIGGH